MPPEWVWDGTRQNINWSMTDQGSDKTGRETMRSAAAQGSMAHAWFFQQGFHSTQRGKYSVLAGFDACYSDDAKRVYNIGREILGLSHI